MYWKEKGNDSTDRLRVFECQKGYLSFDVDKGEEFERSHEPSSFVLPVSFSSQPKQVKALMCTRNFSLWSSNIKKSSESLAVLYWLEVFEFLLANKDSTTKGDSIIYMDAFWAWA